MIPTTNAEIISLLELSAQVGQNLLLTQASTGNTSVKLGGSLWIKASGKWLADAMEDDIFIGLDLERVRDSIGRNCDPSRTYEMEPGSGLRPSVETPMHAVLPHPVVVHVHSVNTIACAVREDAPAQLQRRLEGLRWTWIPYVPSGLPLARAIQKAAVRSPGADVFILGNHGLVVGAEDCDEAAALLQCVEQRLGTAPRRAPNPDDEVLERVAANSAWALPRDRALHALATDPVSVRILAGGLLYPCQAIFCGLNTPALFRAVSPPGPSGLCGHDARPFLMMEGCGVVLRETIAPAESAILSGLARVVQRIDSSAQVRYLSEAEASGLKLDAYRQGSGR
ncbi:MAG TPA: class II aldolase/adducin family protein [Bryobacteraceae bacterium]|nr:class II aldolase/adducin family protein [Bryobacteraceae bacterium]